MQGQLFTRDFLNRAIRETLPYQELSRSDLDALRDEIGAIYSSLRSDSTLNEAQTEQLVINKVLATLGWSDDYLPQVNATGRGREDVPDGLLFADSGSKQQALKESRDDRRYRHGIAILEAKRWLRQLDRGDGSDPADPGAPSSQMLRYLSRIDVASDRAVKWGILTNGAVWRLYWQDARSRSEEFFEVNVAATLGVPGIQSEPDAPEEDHALRLFFLLFRREAFLPQSWDGTNRTFHAYALSEARLYQETVSQNLGQRVFEEIFPRLAQALAKGDPRAETISVGEKRGWYTANYLDQVREAALILLYRLLFIFYAEDRGLLPVRDRRYHGYSARRLREQVRDDTDANKEFSSRIGNIWQTLRGVFTLIDQGDDKVGMPAYNGGLFDSSRTPLLERTSVPDGVMAPIIDALSRRTDTLQRLWINYRDLAVSHLGGIYERLLAYVLDQEVHGGQKGGSEGEVRLIAKLASFARKVSGSYYTHDDLVHLLLRESVGLLVNEKLDAFQSLIKRYKSKNSLQPPDWNKLSEVDPATAILELTVCDPAMGSGHFLVALVDYMADRVLEAADIAAQSVAEQGWAAASVEQGHPWQSPLVTRIAAIRREIKKQATKHSWNVTDTQLDDRHIVRRIILKKCVFGVDKNPMSVELAKTALWLHTFTVGAPLSFLDHHLKCGDSLHGERLPDVQENLTALGMLFQQTEMKRLEAAARDLGKVADLDDADIAEARLSRQLTNDAERQMEPILHLLDFWRALRWRLPGWPVSDTKKLSRIGDADTGAALAEILHPSRNLVAALSTEISGSTEAVRNANTLLAQVRALSERERFLHWWTVFPTVFTGKNPGFDVLIGNPPWDRIKFQQVEWFAERDRKIAAQPRAADRNRMVKELERVSAPLWQEYQEAAANAETNARVLTKGGDYPLLGRGDVNLYSLFVERSHSLVKPHGLVALLTPSGIAADKGAAEFFRSISSTGRISALFDFENRGNSGSSFFEDVHSSFKFCALVFGGKDRRFKESRCAFYLHEIEDLNDPDRVLTLNADDFRLVNPNTGSAPIFRNKRDARITTQVYRSHPVLVELTGPVEKRVWPVKYATMFHMKNNSNLFMTRSELERKGYKATSLGHWKHGSETALPLYEGKMVQMFDHRAADVVLNTENLHRPANPEPIQSALKEQFDRYPVPQYWVDDEHIKGIEDANAVLCFKDVTATTNARTMIAALVPRSGFGNTLAMVVVDARTSALLAANFNSFAFDFIARQKVQGQHLNWYIVEQLPVIAPGAFDRKIGGRPIADFVIEQVLHLSYTALDMEPFAHDLGFNGKPFLWNDTDRRRRMAALDALFMQLYGIDAADAGYILDTFPIIRMQDMAAFGDYRTKTLILDGMRCLDDGKWPEV